VPTNQDGEGISALQGEQLMVFIKFVSVNIKDVNNVCFIAVEFSASTRESLAHDSFVFAERGYKLRDWQTLFKSRIFLIFGF
jgi:hypothetical protein